MTEPEFRAELDALAERIGEMPETQRHSCQAELHSLLHRAKRAGLRLPEEARQLDEVLTDAAIEAQFDNMPV